MATNRILIVDDEETLCEVLKLNLENEGYDVDTAFSAEQALGYNLKEYSLILLARTRTEHTGKGTSESWNASGWFRTLPSVPLHWAGSG